MEFRFTGNNHNWKEGDEVSIASHDEDHGTAILEGLRGINAYLAMINSRLETLMLSDLPDYVTADLLKVYQAEEQASHIVRGLNIYCLKNLS
jgi:hypothetical protein